MGFRGRVRVIETGIMSQFNQDWRPDCFQGILHVLAVKGISKEIVDELLEGAEFMKEKVLASGGIDILKHHVLGCLFYEPSTRTNCSFQAAMLRLGGKVLAVNEQVHDLSKSLHLH